MECMDPVEDCPWRSPREILGRRGYAPPPPDALDDRQLPGRLWEFLYAAAACRFLFCGTNHLDDRTLYRLLWEKWLDEPTDDLPSEAETNTTTIISEYPAGGRTAEEIWLRYYADEADHDLWHDTEPDFVFPPHEDPPWDRDRFLPKPPVPPAPPEGGLPGDDEDDPEAEPDPLGLHEVDREIAAAKKETRDFLSPDPDSALEARLRATEPENWTPPAVAFAAQHIPLLPPAEITDEMLVPILWELLHHLAVSGFYVLHTDHLSDLELYVALWERGMRDPAYLPGRSARAAWFHDFLGSWGNAELQLWLRYYATDEERAKHAEQWPKDVLPPKEKPAFNRDWRTPKGPF